MGGLHDLGSEPLAPGAERSASSVDALSDVLEAVRLTGALFFVVEAATPWIAEAPASSALAPAILPRTQHVVSYHVITQGVCWCHMLDEQPLRLEAGDVIVIPHGDAYAISSSPGISPGLTLDVMLMWFRQMASGQLPFVVTEGRRRSGPYSRHLWVSGLRCASLQSGPDEVAADAAREATADRA
jgi:hypothetical protein